MSKVQLITNDLGSHLIDKIEGADTVCVLSSFVMKSGVKFIKDALKKAAQNGRILRYVQVIICTLRSQRL